MNDLKEHLPDLAKHAPQLCDERGTIANVVDDRLSVAAADGRKQVSPADIRRARPENYRRNSD